MRDHVNMLPVERRGLISINIVINVVLGQRHHIADLGIGHAAFGLSERP